MRFPLLVAGSLLFIFLLSIVVFASSSIPGFPLWDVINGTQDINNTNSGNVGIGVAQASAKLEIGGGIKLNPNGPKPLCNNRNERGIIWFTKSSNGDYLELCRYNAEGSITTIQNTLPMSINEQSCARSSANNRFYCFAGSINQYAQNQIIEIDPTTNNVVTKNAFFPHGVSLLSCAENSATNLIYCFGGRTSQQIYDDITEYNPITDTISTKSAVLPYPTDNLSCAENSQSHKIYCFGGEPVGFRITEYDPATDTIITKNATLSNQPIGLSCAENSATNLIYCFGGWTGPGPINQIIEYNTNSDTITTKSATLPNPTNSLSCTEDNTNHVIYCYGGKNSGGSRTNAIEKYNPTTDTITAFQLTLPSPTDSLACLKDQSSNSIYCMGGNTNQGVTNQIVKHQSFNILEWIKITN